MTPDERWLAAVWPWVRGRLPAPPARVLEIGCGPLGGFVPMLRPAGYVAVGVDPDAPEGPWYQRAEFGSHAVPWPADAVVACTSLHHVAGLGEVLDRVAMALAPGGALVVVEWARERFDVATARWCFARLAADEEEPGWLHRCHTGWRASGQPWESYLKAWAEEERLHAGRDILRELRARFDTDHVGYGPYFFAELAGTSEAGEQAAIDAGEIQATRIQYLGRRRRPGA